MRSKPKRLFRRTMAVLLGLWLGWLAADVAFEQVPGAGLATPAFAAAGPSGEGADHADHEHVRSVEALKPHDGAPWIWKVILFSALLFGAAALIGPAVMSLKAPEPPEPADDHGHDAGDSHGGGHGHGHGDSHGHSH